MGFCYPILPKTVGLQGRGQRDLHAHPAGLWGYFYNGRGEKDAKNTGATKVQLGDATWIQQKDAEATCACVRVSGGGSAPQAQMLEVALGTAVL